MGGGGGPDGALLAKLLPDASTFLGRDASNAAQAASAVEARYRTLVETLPTDQQAWERTLQDNLGNYYLPRYKRRRVEGRSGCWDFVQDDPSLPRVLLIGDSVSGGYTLAARKHLAGKANVHKAPENCGPTGNGLKKLDIWLGEAAIGTSKSI